MLASDSGARSMASQVATAVPGPASPAGPVAAGATERRSIRAMERLEFRWTWLGADIGGREVVYQLGITQVARLIDRLDGSWFAVLDATWPVWIDIGERATAAATKAAGEVSNCGRYGTSRGCARRSMHSIKSGLRARPGLFRNRRKIESRCTAGSGFHGRKPKNSLP